MKKFVYFAAAAACGILFMAGCAKEESAPVAEGFSITVNTPDTKTVFDGETYKVDWEADDALGVVIDDGISAELYKFTKAAGNTFSCAGFEPAEGTSYTYYVLYPYDDTFTVADGSSNAVVKISSGAQSDLNAAGHIKTPLYGMASAEGTASPAVTLAHAAAVMKINVANYTGAELTVSSVGLASIDENAVMSGTFSIDFATGELTAAETSNEASVTLDAKTLANESSADFYVAVAPFATTADLSVKVNDEEFEKNGVSYDFKAGKVYTTAVTCGTPEVAIEVASATSGALTQTVEDENVYANLVAVSGDIDIAVQFNGVKYYLCPADGAFKDGEAVKVSIKKTAETHWTLPEADGQYRFVYNKLNNSVTIYSPENEFNTPATVQFLYGNSDREMSREIVSGNYYLYLNNGDDGWGDHMKVLEFNASNADPQILVWKQGEWPMTIYEKAGFSIKIANTLADVVYEDKGTTGDDPEGASNMTFTSKVAAFSPASGIATPMDVNTWMPMQCVRSNERWAPASTPFKVSKIILDVRNNRIYIESPAE